MHSIFQTANYAGGYDRCAFLFAYRTLSRTEYCLNKTKRYLYISRKGRNCTLTVYLCSVNAHVSIIYVQPTIDTVNSSSRAVNCTVRYKRWIVRKTVHFRAWNMLYCTVDCTRFYNHGTNTVALLMSAFIRIPHTHPVPKHKSRGNMENTNIARRASCAIPPHSLRSGNSTLTNLPLATPHSWQGYARHTAYWNTSSESAVHTIEQKRNKARKQMKQLVSLHPPLLFAS